MANTPAYLAKSQFVGQLHLDFGNYVHFNEFAYDVEQDYLLKLLGYEIKSLLEASPSTEKYANILNGCEWTDTNGVLKKQRGFKEMVKYFFYYRFRIEEEDPRTKSGDPTEAYIKAVSGAKHILNKRIIRNYNRGVIIFNEIIEYMTYIEGQTSDTYENWSYETLEESNSFGI